MKKLYPAGMVILFVTVIGFAVYFTNVPITQPTPPSVPIEPQVKVKPAMSTATQTPNQSETRFDALMGGSIDLADYAGKVVLVVNTASQCGYTGQYAGLETLYKARNEEGLVVVGVPSNEFGGQEPGSAGDIAKFCELNYGVTFPMAAKTSVRGGNAHPFYRNALVQLGATAQPSWNFHKILVGKDGKPVAAFASGVTPNAPELQRAIDAALGA